MALVIAMVMVVAMSGTAFASGDPAGEPAATTTKAITLNKGKAGHTYTLYQIFTGDTTETDKELVNIQWGSDANATFKAAYATAAAAAENFEGKDARTLAQEWISNSYLGTGTSKELTADGKVEFTGLKEGYYLVVDTSGPSTVTEGDYYSAVVVEVVKNVEIDLKGSAPTSEKKVKDTNDSDATHTSDAYADSADYDIGDAVPFQLKATTADNVAAYKKYHITFQDKQSNGLAAPTSWTVTVLGKTFTVNATGAAPAAQTTDAGTKITVSKVDAAEGNTFAIKVEFEPAAVGETPAATYLNSEVNSIDILVTYTATLNSSAVIGEEGNPNESYITYSNKPESNDGSEEGKTPEDKVIVFTYKIDIDKIDETGAALNGANFTLYKQVNSGDTGAEKGSDITFGEGVEHSKINADKYYVEVSNKTGDANGSTFEFKGIDDGTYVLVETTVPAGYNAFNSAEVTVTAEHSDGNTPALTSLTATAPFTTNAEKRWVNSQDVTKKNNSKHTTVSGELYTEIENNSGATLPSTGGIGTTIFYIIGAILVVGAGVLLVTRRRMRAE